MKYYKTLFTTFALLFCLLCVSKAYCEEIHYYYGDANGNGTVTSEDALLILKDAAKIQSIEDELCKTLADIDKSGELTANDALETLKVAAKLNPSTEYVPEPAHTPEIKWDLIVDLLNDFQGVYVDENWNIIGDCSTSVNIYYGGLDITNLVTWPEEIGLKYEIKESEGITGYWDADAKTYHATSIWAEEAYVDITAIYQGDSKTARFTVVRWNDPEPQAPEFNLDDAKNSIEVQGLKYDKENTCLCYVISACSLIK